MSRDGVSAVAAIVSGAAAVPISLQPRVNDRLILDPQAPLEIARKFIATRFTIDGARALHHQNETFYAYCGTHFPPLAQDDLRAQLYHFLDGALKRSGDSTTEPFKPNRAKVGEVYDALEAAANLPAIVRAPTWLGDAVDLAAEDIIVCTNGLLHLPSGDLLRHSPDFYTYNALDFDYRPNAPEPLQWFAFLKTLWPKDEDSIATLQEMAGLFLTGDTSHQKAFLLIGPKRSGKGTIARVLSRLLGPDNVSGPTLSGLAQNFGLASLIGKRLAIISDARLSARVDQHIIAERLLAITGEDAIDVPRKFLPDWHGRLQSRFLILSNELPRLTDASGALASRFILLVLRESFYGREDHNLADRLMPELPGILNWAIAGWRRLRKRGHFVQPASAAEAAQELDDLGSPIGAFLRECCTVEPGHTVGVSIIFDAWCTWCKNQGRDHPGTLQTFGRDLRAAIPGLTVRQPRMEDGSRFRLYEGVGLLRWS